MKQPAWTYLAVIAAAPAAFAAQTPAEAIAAGRAAIEMKQYDRAIIVMQDAIPAATMLKDEKEKANALAAIHFYSALAFSELERDDKTREELREFFRFRQGGVKLDESKYPVPFVRAFNDVAPTVRPGNSGGTGVNRSRANSFDSAYPGFNAFSTTKPVERKISEWAKSPESVLIATDTERRDWGKLTDDDARRDFVSHFWQRRDSKFRDEFERRVAFADDVFANERTRGSLTDRGRVFVLIGIPNRVTQQPLLARACSRPGSATRATSRGRWRRGCSIANAFPCRFRGRRSSSCSSTRPITAITSCRTTPTRSKSSTR